MITIEEKHLLDLLEEALPYLRFCIGGCDVDATLGKIEFDSKAANRTIEKRK